MLLKRINNTIIIRLEARLQPNIGFTIRRIVAVFTVYRVMGIPHNTVYNVLGDSE